MDEMTKKLEELLGQTKRGKILGIGIVVNYDNGLEDLQRYGNMTYTNMKNSLAREKDMAEHLGLSESDIN